MERPSIPPTSLVCYQILKTLKYFFFLGTTIFKYYKYCFYDNIYY